MKYIITSIKEYIVEKVNSHLVEVTPNKYVYHTSNPIFRDSISKEGLIPKGKSESWLSDTKIDGEVIFVVNSNKEKYFWDSTYDDDIYRIDTSKLNNKWFNDPNFDSDGIHLITFERIPLNSIELIYKGSFSLDESKDPKVGTGKKPKNSSRRLYTDENPKDTVSVKFRTKEDVVSTINSSSFKSKSHKRQSQILNLIEQRLRVAVTRAKDEKTIKRLKRAHDYIKSKCESSKEKTKKMNESIDTGWTRVESRDYWEDSKSGEAFTKYEIGLVNGFCDKYYLRNINWGFGTSIRLEKEASAVDMQVYGPHKILWSISIVKSADEWFWVFVKTVEKVLNGEQEDFYKADQIDGLMNLLEFIYSDLQKIYK